MAVTYEKTFEIEIINELSASVYNRVLNYVLNHELNKNVLRPWSLGSPARSECNHHSLLRICNNIWRTTSQC